VLTFDEPTHTYRWHGKVVPSVTQLLECCYDWGFITPEQLEAAGDRGTYVHQLCELDDLGELDEAAERDGEHFPRLLAWRKFCADYGANWSGIETRHYSAMHGFAGTIDRDGKLEKFSAGWPWIIDVKSSESTSPVWGMQLAAYRQLLAETYPVQGGVSFAIARRGTVRLLANGEYRFDEWKEPTDWPTFAAIVTLYNWKKRYG
jgi:hypothetical protein